MESKKKPFWERLLDVIEGANYVQKRGRNKEQNYSYAMEADFLELVKPLLVEAGIIPIPTYEVLQNEQVQTQAGKPANLVTLRLTLQLADAFSDEAVEVVSIGQGRDPQDKACYKAMTGAMKYALSKAFMIPTGDDPEDEEEEEEKPASRKGPPELPADKKAAQETAQMNAFIDAVTKVRYGLSDTAFAQVMHEFEAITWPDDLLVMPVARQRLFYKALVARSTA